MTKIYLVTANEVDENGNYKKGGHQRVVEVFTNKKLAIKAREFYNRKWKEAVIKDEKLRFLGVEWYSVDVKVISHFDFSIIGF